MSRVEAYYHIVIATKDREDTLPKEQRRRLYAYIYGILRNKGCIVCRIGGVGDHLHILTTLPPTIALADLMRDLKSCSSHWLREDGHFPSFAGWEREYAAFSCSSRDTASVTAYIRGQEEHHSHSGSIEEWAVWWNRVKPTS